MSQILIITHPQDYHAFAVALGLRKKGVEPVLWFSSDFPQKGTESVFIGDNSFSLEISDSVGSLPVEASVIWNRRPCYVIDKMSLHPADHDFADLNCRIFRHGSFDLLHRDSFWVNPHHAVRRQTKLTQLHGAQKVGLQIPQTLVTNDPEKIRQFYSASNGEVIYKALSTQRWRSGETYWVPYTARMGEEFLEAESSLRSAPGIFQQLVPKKFELRITLMGSYAITAKILSQESKQTMLDWRRSPKELRMEDFDPPEQVIEKCKRLLKDLGLVFGCFDFIVTPDDRYVFLEVNQMGQFLFVEHYTRAPLLDSFCEFLMHGQENFDYGKQVRPVVRMEEVRAKVKKEMEENLHLHVEPEDGSWIES